MDEYVTHQQLIEVIEAMSSILLFDMFLGGVLGGFIGAILTNWYLLKNLTRRDKELRSDDEAPSRPL